jgi:circadian clock protein KaiC
VSGTTTLLLTHPRRWDVSDPTFTIVDAILAIKTVPQQLRSVRLVSVLKLRGVAPISGWHTAAITREGFQVYPRLEAIVAADGLPPHVPAITRYAFEAPGLTEMMGGGVVSSSATFLIGTPGSGKTFFGLAFLSDAVKHDEPALFFGFHETPDRLLKKADSVGLALSRGVKQGLVQLHWEPPSELLADEAAERILRIVDERGVRRLVLDGYDQFKRGTMTGDRTSEFFSAFCDLLRTRGVAVVMTTDMPRIAGDSFDLPIGELSPIVDNIIHVRSTEIHAQFRRLIAILKVREQDYDRSIREFSIDSKGIRIGEVFTEGEALLTGKPQFGR